MRKIIPYIKSYQDVELNVEMNEIYEDKMLLNIEKFKTNNIKENIIPNTYLNKLKELYNKAILCTTQEKVRKKYIRNNLDRAEYLISSLLSFNGLNKEININKELVAIKKNIQEINGTNEEIIYIDSIIETCNNFFIFQKALLLYNEKQYFNSLEKLKLIKNCNDKELFHVEELENKCYLLIGKNFEEEGNLEKAEEYYTLIKNNKSEVIRIKIIILKNKIQEADKNKEYDKVINLFIDLSILKNDGNKPITSEDYYLSVLELFYQNLILLILKSIEENESKNNTVIEEKLKEIIKKINDNDNIVKKNINDLLNLFKEQLLLKDKKAIYKLIEKNINNDLSDMTQRVYIQFLINVLMDINEEDNKIKTIDYIIIYVKKNYYLSQDNIIKLRAILKEFNKTLLIKLSELFLLIIRKGLDYSKETIQIIGNIIIKLIILKSKKNLEYSEVDYNIIIKHLFQSFEILINQQTFDSSNIVKIYEKIILLEVNNKELLYVFFSGLIIINQKKYEIPINILNIILNYSIKNEGNDKLMELIIDQLKIGQNPRRFDLIPKLMDAIIDYYQNIEDYLFKTLIILEIPYDFYSKKEFIKGVENYLKKKICYNANLYKFLRLIPLSVRTDYIEEKFEMLDKIEYNQSEDEEIDLMKLIQRKQEKKDLTNLVSNYRKKKLNECEKYAVSGIKIKISHLKNIENNLEIKGIFDILYKILLSQKDMISSLNLYTISRYFSNENYQLFDLILENNSELFKISSLRNIVEKLSEDNERQNKCIFHFFQKLNKKRKIPDSINEILDIYRKIQNNEIVLKSSEENSLYLFIKTLYKLPKVPKNVENTFSLNLAQFFEKQKDYKTVNKMIMYIFNLILKNSIDIGDKNFKFCINNIHESLLLKKLSLLLSSKKISKDHKNIIFSKLLENLIKSREEKQFQFINEMKYFNDNEEITEQILSFIISLLEMVDENELDKSSIKGKLYREILYVIGNMLSLDNNREYSKIIKLFSGFEKYKFILKETSRTKLKPEEIFYIYSTYVYMNEYNNANQNCLYFLKLPRNFLIKQINRSLKETSKIKTFSSNLKYFEDFNKFDEFSPIRDHFLRQLIYQKEIPHENFGNILVSKCMDNETIWKYKGDLIDGKKWGLGVVYYNNGDIYYGNFVNDKKDGEGIFINKSYPRGKKQIWKEGVLEE